MTENEARQVLLLQAREEGEAAGLWPPEDRLWATRQAVATVGESVAPERFVVARAVVALQRLLPRDAAGRRWLARRAWHPAWVLLALVLGFTAGLLADQLGAPQRVNLLAPAVWVVVAWNLLVYVSLGLSAVVPLPGTGLRAALARLAHRGDGVAALWARHAEPLSLRRLALVLHAAAAALALGLMAGLYLRGLVLDYRAGWQSTFLDAAQVQSLLGGLLAPASLLTGITLPDVAPLRVGPDGVAQASAAPWIHLYAATLGLFVLLPRSLLALRAAGAAAAKAQRFPLPLATPYFEALHPLMRPGLPRAVRLLWVSSLPSVTLLGQPLSTLSEAVVMLRSEHGDELHLLPLPAAATPAATSALALPHADARPWWSRWWPQSDPTDAWLPELRTRTDAVLLATSPSAPRPAWLSTLAKPVLVLMDAPQAEAPALPLGNLAEGWLPDGRLFTALVALLPDDPRLRRLAEAWRLQQQARFDAGVAEMATSLGRIASAREAVADEGMLSRRGDAQAPRAALLAALQAELREGAARLSQQLGQASNDDHDAAPAAAAAAVHKRMGEGRAAMVGGVLSGALAGLKADLLSGGLTMGAGAVAGGLIGALGAAGAARGLNVVRGTDTSFAAWDEATLGAVTEALLLRHLALLHGLAPDAARQRLAPVWAAHRAALNTLWRGRRHDQPGEAERIAAAVQPLLARVLKTTLGGA